MNAIEFVKKFGVDEAKDFINETVGFGDVYCQDGDKYLSVECDISDLKQIVDAWELVEKYKNRHGGIRFRIRWGMFRYGDTQEFNDRLKQAINLVEQCNA